MNIKNTTKFILIGATSLLAASLSHASNQVQIIPNGYFSGKVLEKASKININSISPNTPIIYNIVDSKKISELGSDVDVSVSEQTCKVNLNVTNEFKVGDFSSGLKNKIISNSLKLDNESQEELRTEFSVYHEASHCDLYYNGKPFSLSNKKLEDKLNQYYIYSGSVSDGQKTYSGLYQTMHENYADALATIMLIKKHGATPDVLKVLKVVSLERSEIAISYQKFGQDSHISSITMDEILKPSNLNKIIETNNIKDLKIFAKEVSTNGTLKSINTCSDPNLVFSLDTIASGIFTFTAKLLYSENYKKEIEQNNQMDISNKVTYIEAKKVIAKLASIKDLSSLKTDKDVYNFINKNAQLIGDLSLAQAQIFVAIEQKKGNEVLVDISKIKDEFSKEKKQDYQSIANLAKSSTEDSILLSNLVQPTSKNSSIAIKNEANSASLKSSIKP